MNRQLFTFIGMNRDLDPAKSNTQYAYEIRNLRVTAQEDSTMLALVTEKGNTQYIIVNPERSLVESTVLGYCVLNEHIVLFNTDYINDYIYRLDIHNPDDGYLDCECLYTGNLNFRDPGTNELWEDLNIETLGIYENDKIQKVYWIDNINQPRVINIVRDIRYIDYNTLTNPFDFVPALSLQEKVEVKKTYLKGLFESGTIQYVCTYFDTYSRQSNAFYVSPIYYVSPSDKGASAEDSVSNAFKIRINRPDANFKNIRIYSIQRTSENGTPICKKVSDINIDSSLQYIYNEYKLAYNPLMNIIGFDDNITSDINKLIVFERVGDIGQPIEKYLVSNVGPIARYEFPKRAFVYDTDTGKIWQYSPRYDTDEHLVILHQRDVEITTIMTSDGEDMNGITGNAFITWNSIPYVEIIDSGMNNEVVDYAEVLYAGGSAILPKAMEQKDMTLFFGNYRLNSLIVDKPLIDTLQRGCTITFGYSEITIDKGNNSWYPYHNQLDLSAKEITTFKGGESYSFGVILQDEFGTWSSVIPLKSVYNQFYPLDKDGYFRPVKAYVKFTDAVYTYLEGLEPKVKQLKLVVLNVLSPNVVYQGIVCPTVYSFSERKARNVYARSSWFMRSLYPPSEAAPTELHNRIPQNMHNYNIVSKFDDNGEITVGEIYNVDNERRKSDALLIDVQPDSASIQDKRASDFFIDWNVLTLHSPDIEIADDYEGNDWNKLRLVGVSPISSIRTDMNLSFSSAEQSIGRNLYIPGKAYDLALFNYQSFKLNDDGNFSGSDLAEYPIFTWHRLGSITAQKVPTGNNPWIAEIGTKAMSTISVANKNLFFYNKESFNTSNLKVYRDDETLVSIDNDINDIDCPDYKLYSGSTNIVNITKTGVNPVELITNNNNTKTVKTLEYKLYEGVPIKYKSSSHGVLALKYTNDHRQTVLPNVLGNTSNSFPFWSQSLSSQVFPASTTDFSIIKELDFTEYGLRFEFHYDHTALQHSYWIRCRNESTSFYLEEGFYIFKNAPVVTFQGREGSTTIDLNKKIWHLKKRTITPYGHPEINWAFVDPFEDIYEHDQFIMNDNSLFLWRNHPIGDTFTLTFDLYTDNYTLKTFSIDVLRSRTNIAYYTSGPYDPRVGKYNGSYILTDETILPITHKSTVYNTVNIPNTVNTNYVYLAEYYNDNPLTPDIYNPTNIWNVAGMPYSINNRSLIEASIGDTYYQRFDTLKTYPYSLEDKNQVIEIFSFMCETKHNIDGRYDSRRGWIDNTTAMNTNFNLINPAYTQPDNVFAYNYLDVNRFSIEGFPNQILWTLTKTYGSDIDNWTHIIPTAYLDMNGSLGEVRALKLWNKDLICFQDKGIAKINYNERAAISTQDGVPIELSNSGKVDGYTYISDKVGCTNKNTIQTGKDTIYFIDSNNKEIYRWKDGFESLSKAKGFNTYLYNNTLLDHAATFYDTKLKDVYFKFKLDNNTMEYLVYNETLQDFTSFIDYNAKFIFNINDSLVSIKEDAHTSLWKQFDGDYLSFYGEPLKDYSIEFVSSEYPIMDKIFTNIEFRADVLKDNITEANSQRVHNSPYPASANIKPFSYIRVWNEYQDTDKIELNSMIRAGSNLSQKFRIWRGDIPRDKNGAHKLQRIRSPWARIKLFGKLYPHLGKSKTVIHDMNVLYM